MTVTKSRPDKSPLSLPRILCLHGGGVNARVFELQCRSIIAHLRPAFRLVFADGPYLSHPHPDIVAVYGRLGPFHSWLPTDERHPAFETVTPSLLAAMKADPGTGEWMGVLGFSQGAKIAASLLWAQQAAVLHKVMPMVNFEFGILMAGRGPVVRLDPQVPSTRYVSDLGILGGLDDFPPARVREQEHIISIPTVHVHGLEDEGLEHHRLFLERYFAPETTQTVEWHGAHRLPIKSNDVLPIVHSLARAVGFMLEAPESKPLGRTKMMRVETVEIKSNYY